MRMHAFDTDITPYRVWRRIQLPLATVVLMRSQQGAPSSSI